MRTTEERIADLKAEFENKVRDILAEEKAIKFEVGWYKSTGKGGPAAGNRYRYPEGFGIGCHGDWNGEGERSWLSGVYVRMDKREVEEMLIKEAERRGFKKGVVFRTVQTKRLIKLNGKIRYGWGNRDNLYIDNTGEGIIYEAGEWAEIVKGRSNNDRWQ